MFKMMVQPTLSLLPPLMNIFIRQYYHY